MDTNLLIEFHNLILEIFNKEAIAIFCIFCFMFFGLAALTAIWALSNGEFKDIERAKFEMLEDTVV